MHDLKTAFILQTVAAPKLLQILTRSQDISDQWSLSPCEALPGIGADR